MKVTIYMIPLNKSHFGILIGLVDAGTNNANIFFAATCNASFNSIVAH